MKRFSAYLFALVLCLSMFALFPVRSQGPIMGPYPDELYYVVYPDPNAAVLALQTGAIDMCAVATPEQARELAAQGFSLRFIHLPGGGDASFNFNHDLCNDKAFRQALAHLAPVDEVLAQYIYPLGVRKYCFNGPAFGIWTTEEGLHIYDFDPIKAAQMLDAAGYRVHPDGDVRTYPNGTKLRQISVMWAVEDPPQGKIYERWADEMEALKIPVKREPVTFDTMFYRMYTGDFDIVEVPWGWSPWANSLYVLVSDRGPLSWLTNWHNATFEAYVDIVMNSVNETEVQEATANALRLMTEELPYISFYEPVMCYAFNPGLRGIIEDLYLPWSLLRMQWATPGGTVKIAIGTQPQTLNPLTSATNLDAWLSRIVDGISGLGLIADDPWTATPSIKYACTSFVQELTPDGGMKMRIVLRPNMYWHDGVEVTAQDVAFCLEYSSRTGCPLLGATENFVSATVIDKYTVELYYSKPSLWTKYLVSYYALAAPKHIWNNDTSIYGEPAGLPGIQAGYAYGVGDPLNFRPEFVPYPGRENELTCLIGSGAYIFRPDSWHGDEYIKLYANRNYHRRPRLTDTNFDFKVDIKDIFTMAKAFGTQPGHARWNAVADVDNNEKIDIRDLYAVAKDFGKTW